MAKKPRLGRGLSTLLSEGGSGTAETTTTPARAVEVEVGVAAGHDTAGAPGATGAGRGDPARAEAGDASTAMGGSDGGGVGDGDAGGGGGLVEIALDAIVANPFQPRRHFDEASLAMLAASIRSEGVIQPLLVRPHAGGGYELVAGERRWRAARMAGLATAPALVRSLDDRSSAEWAIVENIQREDLNPIERAESFRVLMDRFGLTQQQVSERVGVERSSVSNLVRLLDLEDGVRELIARGLLSMGLGKVLLSAPPGLTREALAAQAVEHGWTVRRLEEETRALIRTIESRASGQSEDGSRGGVKGRGEGVAASASIRDLERQIGEQLGTKVRVRTRGRGDRGKLEIEFFGLDHFDGLLARLGVSVD